MSAESSLEVIKYKRGSLQIIDQVKLPLVTEYIAVNDVQTAWKCVKNMNVRGAPAIAIVSCLSLAVQMSTKEYNNTDDLMNEVKEKLDYLVSARPTAVNIRTARDDIVNFMQQQCAANSTMDAAQLKQSVVERIEGMLEKDVSDNMAIGKHGAEAILHNIRGGHKVSILTHCNTGSLATAGYGTALGVVRSLHALGRLEHVYFTETRPFNQGARLTSYELLHDAIPCTMVCDSATAWLMKNKKIHAVVTGADHVNYLGETANKIGTYSLAVIAQHHNIPFYIAAPSTTCTTGKGNEGRKKIEVEERPSTEMTMWAGIQVAPPNVTCWNPSFDITPPELITAIITENGYFPPGYFGHSPQRN